MLLPGVYAKMAAVIFSVAVRLLWQPPHNMATDQCWLYGGVTPTAHSQKLTLVGGGFCVASVTIQS